jgi:hypothetical protein
MRSDLLVRPRGRVELESALTAVALPEVAADILVWSNKLWRCSVMRSEQRAKCSRSPRGEINTRSVFRPSLPLVLPAARFDYLKDLKNVAYSSTRVCSLYKDDYKGGPCKTVACSTEHQRLVNSPLASLLSSLARSDSSYRSDIRTSSFVAKIQRCSSFPSSPKRSTARLSQLAGVSSMSSRASPSSLLTPNRLQTRL